MYRISNIPDSYFPVSIRLAPLPTARANEGGDINGAVVVVNDVTFRPFFLSLIFLRLVEPLSYKLATVGLLRLDLGD